MIPQHCLFFCQCNLLVESERTSQLMVDSPPNIPKNKKIIFIFVHIPMRLYFKIPACTATHAIPKQFSPVLSLQKKTFCRSTRPPAHCSYKSWAVTSKEAALAFGAEKHGALVSRRLIGWRSPEARDNETPRRSYSGGASSSGYRAFENRSFLMNSFWFCSWLNVDTTYPNTPWC